MDYSNLQKVVDGKRTYSITPHIPGGFVTIDTMEKIIGVAKKYKGKLESGEIGIPMENSSLVLPCGIYGRWEIWKIITILAVSNFI